VSVIVKGKNANKPHTVRYWVDGRQKERSFATLAEAKGFKTDADHAQRYQVTPIDPRDGKASFGTACEAYITRMAVSERSRASLRSVFGAHVKPVLGSRTLAAVAADRDAVTDLLTGRMRKLSIDRRRKARQVIVGTLDAAVKAGKLAEHKCDGIELYDDGPLGDRSDFVFPAFAEVQQVADEVGIVVWLMRGCGLRIQEALGVEKADFVQRGTTLRLSRQATRDGQDSVPLKYRKRGEYRDVPVPGWLWTRVKNVPEGPLSPGARTRYATYASVLGKFTLAAKAAGIQAGFHPHSLRHAFASALLGRGQPLGDVSQWLGHRDVNTTYAVYRHMLPEAPVNAVSVLDAEFVQWSSEAA
jgi:integrase